MKKILIGLSFALFGLQSCDVLDVDPQSFYSENVAYASIENVDFMLKIFIRLSMNIQILKNQ